ncbi:MULTISPECIES: hypothetical protein [Tabrizicola]|uniref:hypothetical protein n=1 Tax=Tabrizicola TaxID=1443919 RepID=UPI001081635A|nr:MULTISPECIES: hypothetical protein [Paracoccaceae]
MRIAEITPDRLTLDSRPWALGLILILAILFFLGVALFTLRDEPWLAFGMTLGAALMGVMFVIFVRRVLVIFDRPTGVVVIRTATLLGRAHRSLRLADIMAAGVETTLSHSSTDASSGSTATYTHRPILKTTTGDVPLTQIHSSGDGAARTAEAINRWLAGAGGTA